MPLTFTCAVADLRIGVFTSKERWEMISGEKVYVHTEKYLQPLYDDIPSGKHLWVDASVLANGALADTILSLPDNTALVDDNGFIAGSANTETMDFDALNAVRYFSHIQRAQSVNRLKYPWQIFQLNDTMIREDIALIRSKKASQPLPVNNQYVNEHDIFIDEGARIDFSIINASTGPIYIGRNTTIMEGSLIRGPFALGEGATVKMGTKIYGATTIGPYCTAGGEIKNTVMQAYSNKGHDGYLGDAVIGRWCNLGAGTSNSNVKNTGGEVKMWSYVENNYVPVGAKAGVIMGDYSRTAINTSLNTGTVTGVCCNIFDNELSQKYIPSFSWGGRKAEKYKFEKALQDICNWKKMKHQTLSDGEAAVLKHIFENS